MAKKPKAREIEIQGDNLANLDPIIAEVAAELHFKNCDFAARSANSKRTDSFALCDVFIIDRTGMSVSKIPIGAFTLQVLETDRIMLRVPPPSQRTWGHLSALEKINMARNESKYEDHFSEFIKSLEDRLTHYGVKITLPKRLWRGLREFLRIYKALKP